MPSCSRMYMLSTLWWGPEFALYVSGCAGRLAIDIEFSVDPVPERRQGLSTAVSDDPLLQGSKPQVDCTRSLRYMTG